MEPAEETKAYVEGRLSLKEFSDKVMEDARLQAFLEEDVALPRHVKEDNAFLYMMNQDTGTAAADLNVRDVLSKFLDAKGIGHVVDDEAARDYELVLSAAPSWLYLPEPYVAELLAQVPAALSRTARLQEMKKRIAADFRCLKKPPKWLQTAIWPMRDGQPLVFVGQLPLDGLFHDDAQAYLFVEPASRKTDTIVQVA